MADVPLLTPEGRPLLFQRKLIVQVEDLLLKDFDVSFEVTKSLAPKTPNKAEIKVWGLNEQHRKQLQELEKVYVSLEAGYQSGTSLIFRGDLRDANSAREDTGWVTTITSDSGRTARKRRIVKSFAPGSSVAEVLQTAAKAMGLRLGNTAIKTVNAKIAGTSSDQFFNGYALAGTLVDEMDRLARSTGLEWSVQDDELQFLDAGRPLEQEGIVLTPLTGLIGSAEPGNKGVLEARALMIPDLQPGRRVLLDSVHTQGIYRIETAKYRGGTADREWYVDLELKDEQRKKGKAKA